MFQAAVVSSLSVLAAAAAAANNRWIRRGLKELLCLLPVRIGSVSDVVLAR